MTPGEKFIAQAFGMVSEEGRLELQQLLSLMSDDEVRDMFLLLQAQQTMIASEIFRRRKDSIGQVL